MDRRRLVLAASSAAALSGSAALAPHGALTQAVRTSVLEYVGAMTIMLRTLDWVQHEVSRLLAEQNREDEEWRIDVLAPFAAVEAVREAGRTIVAPGRFVIAHARWFEAVDELGAAGLLLRTGVLDDNDRSLELAAQSLDRARLLLDEVDAFLPRRGRLPT
jgi:hypothetical protein